MRGVFVGVLYKVEVVGVWGRDGCYLLVCLCVSFGCVGVVLLLFGFVGLIGYFFLFSVLESGLTGFFFKF